MNHARVVIAGAAAWAVSIPLGYVINQFLLAGIYSANAAALRPDADVTSKLPVGFVALLFGFLVFAHLYARGCRDGSGIAEGARFGALVGVLVVGFGIIWQWVLYPIDATMSAVMIVDNIAESTLYGAIIGAIYKPA